MRRGLRRKHTVERVVEEAYWDGFFACLENGSPTGALEYASTSGLYQYNGCRRIAYKAGYAYCEEVLAERAHRLSEGHRGLPFLFIKREVPGRVMADAYGEARVA